MIQEPLEPNDLKVIRETKVTRVIQEPLGHKAHRALKGILVQLALRALKVRPAPKVTQEPQALKAQEETRETREMLRP